jgi:Zn-dependent M28 family amino/carboxypeptidase
MAPLDSEGLRRHVNMLAGTIGGRSAGKYKALQSAAIYIESELKTYGYATTRQSFEAGGLVFENIEAERKGSSKPDEIVIVGAHYDTAGGLPGANDNGSGVAATLELARLNASVPHDRTVRFVLFANEEPPYFQTEAMGSLVYAKRCRERNEKIVAMLSLETIGYYSDEPGSQRYPVGFHPGYPKVGNYLGFVSDVRSAALLRRVVKHFRSGTELPSQGAAAPAGIPGVGWSDHWSFWQYGYRAVCVTDTAPYRYPYYHTAQDTPDKLDYTRMAQALSGLNEVVRGLAAR